MACHYSLKISSLNDFKAGIKAKRRQSSALKVLGDIIFNVMLRSETRKAHKENNVLKDSFPLPLNWSNFMHF